MISSLQTILLPWYDHGCMQIQVLCDKGVFTSSHQVGLPRWLQANKTIHENGLKQLPTR